MGLTRILRLAALVLSSGIWIGASHARGGPALEMVPWPEPRACEQCVPVQFGRLEMQLPLAEIGRIVVNDSGVPALHLVPRNASVRDGMLLLIPEPGDIVARYREAGLLQGLQAETVERLFDLLGRPEQANAAIDTMRGIHRLDRATRYTKATRGDVHAYWIESDAPQDQQLYFVIAGEARLHLLAGNVTAEFRDAVMANLRLVRAP